MKKENYREYQRLKRERRWLVEYAMTIVKNWSYYRSSYSINFLDAVVRVLGSKKDYEQFSSYRMGSDSALDRTKDHTTVIASR